MKKKPNFYVVWRGFNTGIFESWEECKKNIDGFSGAKYKSFQEQKEAIAAFQMGYQEYYKAHPVIEKKPKVISINSEAKPMENSICVDASCMGNPGIMEYRGVYFKTGKELFRVGPFKNGTNNIGEFLAIVHCLALLKKNNSLLPVYSDSSIAIKWIKMKKARSKLEMTSTNDKIFDLIERAETWLMENEYDNQILKWETELWGENPADFGRK